MRKPFRTGLVILASAAAVSVAASRFGETPTAQSIIPDPVVFVSRQIPPDGSDFMRLDDGDKAMPGVAGRERFRVAAPGRLVVRETSGTLRLLVDGASPSAASLNLIDVSAPAVSYDATRIAFAGLPAPPPGQTYDTGPHYNPGRWRIFVINADGTGLRQVTFNDPALDALNMSQYAQSGAYRYDDTDPAWLPDGRLVFSSTRLLNVGEYGAAPRSTNLHVVNADGTGEHRITTERNGADRPIIDPLTGRIVYARWWLNGRFPTDRTDTQRDADRGGYASYSWKEGLTFQDHAEESSGGPGTVDANDWVATSVNPDGTSLQLFTGNLRLDQFILKNNYYGGAFTNDGVLYGNFFPDFPLTESGGFGGIRRYNRGARGSDPIWGLTEKTDDFVRTEDPVSLTIIHSPTGYAADPVPLSDGRLLFSWARNPATGTEDIGQDYGLFVLNPSNPANPVLIFDNRGTTELRAQVLRPRPVPPIIPDGATDRPTPTPPTSEADVYRDGTFVFDALNVYFNGPVDMPIVNAAAIGSATTMRFFVNYQRAPLNSDMSLNYPVKLNEVPVPPGGAVREIAPANVSLFEDLRNEIGVLPLTSHNGQPKGGAFVTGFNHGRPGTTQRCVGCHAGHTQIPVPATAEEARWTNLAPGGSAAASSTGGGYASRLINRRARTEGTGEYWRSQSGISPTTQWVQLTFPVPILVRTVRLWGASQISTVGNAAVRLYSDAGATSLVAERQSGAVSDTGTNVAFQDVTARSVRVAFTQVSGTQAALAEVEVIAAGVGSGSGLPSAPTNLRIIRTP